MYASAGGFPVGNGFRTALGSVANRWNNGPSEFVYRMHYDATNLAKGNGRSEIWWIYNPGGAPATTSLRYNTSTCRIVESDITFNSVTNYTPMTTKSLINSYGGDYRPFHTTACHEYGHAQGLGHTTNTYSVMGQDWDHIWANATNTQHYPGEDAMNGSVYVYGSQTSREDLGVAHWRWTGSSQGYSTHARTRIFNSSGVELSKWVSSPEPVYRVDKGQQVRVEFTFENMGGTYSVSTMAYYYLSTNATISSSDTYLGSKTMTVRRDTPATATQTVTIPSNLTSGANYWIGVRIDPNNTFQENYESNNSSYIGIHVN